MMFVSAAFLTHTPIFAALRTCFGCVDDGGYIHMLHVPTCICTADIV